MKRLPKLVPTLALISATALAQTTVYVSPVGDDSWQGTQARPYRTFQKGADEAARRNARFVEFAGGEYVFTQPAVLGTQHSGITFRAATNARPVFSSLVRVTGWTRHNGNVMKAPLPGTRRQIRYLQDRSENWLPRSATNVFTSPDRSPFDNNEPRAYSNITAHQTNKLQARFRTSGSMSLSPVPSWVAASQYDVRIHQTDWSLNIVPISSVTGNTISLRYAATYENLSTINPDNGQEMTEMWILNTLEGIDQPGEWAVIDGEVYLYPRSGTDDIYAPTLTELIRVDAGGDGNTWSGTPVRNVRFFNLTFTGLDYLVTGAQGTRQNPGVITTQHDWGIVDGPASALRFRNAADCEVTGCTFERSGSGGVRLDRYAQRILVEENIFRYLGREAILLGGRGPGYGDVNRNNTIAFNTITAPGREKWDCPAINVDQSTNNDIHHNYIEDTYMSALHLTSSRSVYLGFYSFENARNYYLGRECHFWEVNPTVDQWIRDNEDVLGGQLTKVEAQRFLYNENNRFRNNVLRNCHNMPTLSNGVLYITGQTRRGTNYLTHNYITESPVATQTLYTDSYLDDLDVRGNMVQNTRNWIVWDFNGWYEARDNRGGRGRFVANILADSTLEVYIGGLPALSNNNPLPPVWQDIGNLYFNSTINTRGVGSTNGVAAQLADYVDVYQVLANQDLPNFTSLPGTAAMQRELERVIRLHGGRVPAPRGSVDLELGNGGRHGIPVCTLAGSLQQNQPAILRLRGARRQTPALLIIGTSRIDAPILGGTLVPAPLVQLTFVTSASGQASLPLQWPALQVGVPLFLQYWTLDAAASQGWAASNALSATTQR